MSETNTDRRPNISQATRVKKITVQRVVGKLVPMEPTDPIVWLADFYCYVTGNKLETSTYGDYNRWLGEFKSINLSTGEVLVSANAIFPSIASDIIEAAYRGGNNIGGEAANVMLAFRLGIEHGNNRAGYEYRLRDIVAPSTKSPLDRLYDEVNVVQIEHDKGDAVPNLPHPAEGGLVTGGAVTPQQVSGRKKAA